MMENEYGFGHPQASLEAATQSRTLKNQDENPT